MVLIDPDALDELALDLQAWTRTIHNASEPAATQLGTIGRGDLAGALAQHLAEAGAALELLASDLASRAASMRATEAMLIAHVSALTEPRPARSTSIPEARPVREVWQGLRRLHRLRPAVEHLKRLGLTAPGDAVEAAVARLTSELTVADWQQITLLEAGLDGLDWRPSHGLAANDAAVQGVYNFYARLQLDNVDFQWAGMAATVGAAFYAGWQDLHAVRRLSDDARRWFLSRLTGPIPGTGIVAIPIRPGVVAQVSAAELQWLEVRMLSMQKEIFDDLAWMHVAYRYGGLAALLPA